MRIDHLAFFLLFRALLFKLAKLDLDVFELLFTTSLLDSIHEFDYFVVVKVSNLVLEVLHLLLVIGGLLGCLLGLLLVLSCIVFGTLI